MSTLNYHPWRQRLQRFRLSAPVRTACLSGLAYSTPGRRRVWQGRGFAYAEHIRCFGPNEVSAYIEHMLVLGRSCLAIFVNEQFCR